ncbi:VOC family protein [Ruminococcus gauvreauii]|uniref:VOC family protein n=1 Tax=Ruminococcus gauvreauii TaxID=438033 RepID=A0ABY5VGP3_9FIRM|nr:VOC family protein [Ruminococcus gauvreauii]UWP59472.1 VOC family protein [Ruminococcus gauvreauii]
MVIHHAALYVKDLERAKLFFETYFQGESGSRYHNAKTGFTSYFLSFGDGARLEIMHNPEISEHDGKKQQTGYDHIAFSVGSEKNVDRLTKQLRKDGFTVISGPRTTGDGYYESCILEEEGTRIEITV